MVRCTLVVATAQDDVDRCLDPGVPAVIEQDAEQPLVQGVDDVVVSLDLAGQLQVARGNYGTRLRHDSLDHLAHLEDRRHQLCRKCGRGVTTARNLGDVSGVVARTFEVGDDAKARDDGTEVAGDWLLSGEKVEGLLLYVGVHRVDGGVLRDYLLSQVEIGVDKSLGGSAQGSRNQAGQPDQ